MDPTQNEVDSYLSTWHPEEWHGSEGTHCPSEHVEMSSRESREWSALVPDLRPEGRNVSGQSWLQETSDSFIC